MRDQQYKDGRILCSMCTRPHPIAERAYRMFSSSNLGDSGLFPGSAQLEREVIATLSTLLHGENGCGHVVSGGTEANLTALLAARNLSDVKEPEVVLPESVHFSFTKICNMLKIKPVYVGLTENFTVDVSEMERGITKNTVAIVGNAGSAELGTVDPIEELSALAAARGVYLHVDAAFGGLVIPFLQGNKPKFDFSLEAVQSITVDPHKMGMAAIPAGGILFRNPKYLESIKTSTPYLTDGSQYTVVGTRTGASAASAWAVFKHLGMEGFQRIVSDCMETTDYLAAGIQASGFKVLVKPTLNVVAFRSGNTKRLAEKLWQKGLFVSYVPRYDCIRIVVMPHVKRKHAGAFLTALAEIEKL